MLAPFGYPDKSLVGECINVSALEDRSSLLIHSADVGGNIY
jgi:hypothetical protein